MSPQPHPVQVGSTLYSVVDDGVTRFGALITGAVTDDTFGAFRREGFSVDTARPDLTARALPNGGYAVTGYAGRSFPKISSQPYTVNLVCRAPGFREVALAVVVPQNAVFPVVAPSMVMRRRPVCVQGSVVDDVTRQPVAGALVLSVDDPLSAPPPSAARAVALRVPVGAMHPAGAPVQAVTMAAAGAAALTRDALAGTLELQLSTRAGLASGSVVRLADAQESLVEYGVVAQVGPGAPAAPGGVTLRRGLVRSYYAGGATDVRFVQPAAPGTALALQSAADAGDGILLVAGWPAGGTLAIDLPTPGSVEYHEVGARTDAGGNYALDGVGRARDIFLQTSKGTEKAVQHWFVDYDQSPNLVDFRLR